MGNKSSSNIITGHSSYDYSGEESPSEIGTFYGKNNRETSKLEFDWDLYKRSIKEFTEKSKKFIEFQNEIKIISKGIKLDENTNPIDEARKKFESLTKIFIMYNISIRKLIKLSKMSDEVISNFYRVDTGYHSLTYFHTLLFSINEQLEAQEKLKNEIEGYVIPKDD